MYLNLYIYQNLNSDAQSLYRMLRDIEGCIGIRTTKLSYLYMLSPDKADHPGDFKSRSISAKHLEEGINFGEISSFYMGTSSSLEDETGYFSYVNDKAYGGTSNISLHIPKDYVGRIDECLNNLVMNSCATYAFQIETETALQGVKYILGSTRYKNEKNNFGTYLIYEDVIKQPRMIYPVNYFTRNQLEFVSNGISLIDFIKETCGDNSLEKLGSALFMLRIPSEIIISINNQFGRAGFLISWTEVV